MRQKLILLLSVLGMLWLSAPALRATTVTLSESLGDCTLSMKHKSTGKPVDLGEFKDYKFTVECEPGWYILSIDKDDEHFGSLEVEILSPEHYAATGGVYEIKFCYADITFKSSYYSSKFIRNVDYTVDIELFDQNGSKVNFTPVFNDKGVKYYYLKGWKSHIVLAPTDLHPDYEATDYWGAPGSYDFSICLYKGTEIYLSYPSDAQGGIFQKQGTTHYVPFIELTPKSVETVEGITTKTYRVPVTEKYSYRVSREGALTNAGVFASFDVTDINVTEDDLQLVSPFWQTHDLLGGTNYADIYLNINQRGYLRLKPGDNYQIVNLRTWQLTNSVTENYFIEPDFHYTVLDSEFHPDNSVISIDENGIITAHKKGTAIVEVTYDALNNPSEFSNKVWSALWAENTGTFVVTVDDISTTLPADNIHLSYKPDAPLDSEHDILYYLSDKPGYELIFTPEDGSTVTVANPVVDSESNTVSYPKGFSADNVTVVDDGFVKVLLTFGRNIIRTTNAAGQSNYQVLSAKPVHRKILAARDDDYILPGDSVTVQHSGLFHLAGKLAGIYNQSCYLTFNRKACYPLKELAPWQYSFAGNKQAQAYIITIPTSGTEPAVLSDGALYHYGYGSLPGSHRAVDYGRGIDPNLKAEVRSAYCGSVPDAHIDVTPLANGMKLSKRLAVNSGFTVLSNEAFTTANGSEPIWTSADPEIAKVDENGYVTALKEGKTTITVANPDKNFSIYCDVDVYTQLPDTLYFTEESTVIEIDEQVSGTSAVYLNYGPSNSILNQDDITVRAEDETIATVAKNKWGKLSYTITGVAPGETTVIAACEKFGLSASIKVIVDMCPSTISLNPETVELEPGQTYRLTPTFLPENTTVKKVSWTSSDPLVAMVTNKGVVTANKPGTAQITAADIWDIASGICTVTVKEATSGVEDISVTAEEAEGAVYYNLQGVASESPFKGLNIVRLRDGSTRKIFVR